MEVDLRCLRQELLAAIHVCPALSSLHKEDTFRGLKLTASNTVLGHLAGGYYNFALRPEDDLESLVKTVALQLYGNRTSRLNNLKLVNPADVGFLLQMWQNYEATASSEMKKAFLAARTCNYEMLEDLLQKPL